MVVAAREQEAPTRKRRRIQVAGAQVAGHRRPSSGAAKTIAATVTALVMADTMAITLALPSLSHDPITRTLPVTVVSMLTTVNLAAVAALLATAGRLADLLGRRAVLAAGLTLFAAGAAALVVGPLWPVVLAGRLVQGVGAALMLPSALGLLLGHVRDGHRRAAVALWGSATGIGGLAMHGLGGLVLDEHGWRALFVPIGVSAIALLLLVGVLPPSPAAQRVLPDLLGMLALVAAIAALMLIIFYNGTWGWSSPATLAAAAVTVGGFWLAVARSRSHPGGAVDPALWRCPGFIWGLLTSLLYGVLAFPGLLLAPLVLHERGMSVAEAGLALAPLSATLIVSSLLASRLTRRIGTSGSMYAGAYLSAAGFLVVFATPHAPWGSLAGLFVLGAGLGLVSTTASIAGTVKVDPARYAAAVGAITTGRMLGGAVGPAIAMAYLSSTAQRPDAGYRDILVGCVALTLLLAACALVRGLRHRAGTRLGASPAAATPTAGSATASAEDVARLREVLQRQRARLEAIAQAAEDELAALTRPAPVRTPARATYPTLSAPVSPREGSV